jgi:hypothetical protein
MWLMQWPITGLEFVVGCAVLAIWTFIEVVGFGGAIAVALRYVLIART